MIETASLKPLNIGILGLGLQGAGIGTLVLEQGYRLTGAVDIGASVGRPVRDYVPGACPEALVHGSIPDLLRAVEGSLDVLVIAAATDAGRTLELAREAMSEGVSVLTLHSELFEPDPAWADELDVLGRTTGAGFLSTGVQDTWWVHMPSLAAGSVRNIRSIKVRHVVDVNGLSMQVGREVGIGLSMAEFAVRIQAAGVEQPILGSPLREAARKMGLQPSASRTVTAPVVSKTEVWWDSGKQLLPSGAVIGTEETTTFTTDAGIEFVGILRTVPLQPGELPSDLLVLDADPELRLEHSPFPGGEITNIALVARIPDVLEAGGGVHSAAALPPARYRLPAAGDHSGAAGTRTAAALRS